MSEERAIIAQAIMLLEKITRQVARWGLSEHTEEAIGEALQALAWEYRQANERLDSQEVGE